VERWSGGAMMNRHRAKDGTPHDALSSGSRSLRLSGTRRGLLSRRFPWVPPVTMLGPTGWGGIDR